MKVNHSGWSEDIGSFSYDIYIDEKKTDYEIHYADGSIEIETSVPRWTRPFRTVSSVPSGTR